MVVFGGMASTFGAVVGAAMLTMLPQLLTVLKDYEMVVFGAVMIATMVFLPRGVVPTLVAWEGAKDGAAASRDRAIQGLRRRTRRPCREPRGRHGALDHRSERRRQDQLLNVLSGVYLPDAGSSAWTV